MKLSIHSPDELIAALPFLLGFKAEESVVFVPMRDELPIARIDVPTTSRARTLAWGAIGPVFSRHARPGASVGIVCLSNDRDNAGEVCREFAARFDSVGISTQLMVWGDDSRWHDFDSGESGLQTEAAREQFAAMMALNGHAQPVASRERLAASLVGDRQPIANLLPDVRDTTGRSTPRTEARWALARLQTFHRDGQRLSDRDAARLLVAIEAIPIRDSLWADMDRSNTAAHVALWTDLTRRAPDEVRAAPATLLGFASWLNGEGAKALCALDQVPQDKPYSLATIVAGAIETGMHPREWESVHSTDLRSDFTTQRSDPHQGHGRTALGL